MDSAGDYIYLIIAVIAIISGIARSAKKKTTGSAPKTSKRSWEDVLRELVPVEEDQQPAPATVTQGTSVAEKKKMQEMSSHDTSKDFTKMKARKQVKEELKITKPDLIGMNAETGADQKEEPVVTLDSAEEARKAFIYSEIFNRKYI